jgi:hypothetical protein
MIVYLPRLRSPSPRQKPGLTTLSIHFSALAAPRVLSKNSMKNIASGASKPNTQLRNSVDVIALLLWLSVLQSGKCDVCSGKQWVSWYVLASREEVMTAVRACCDKCCKHNERASAITLWYCVWSLCSARTTSSYSYWSLQSMIWCTYPACFVKKNDVQ